MGTGVLKFRTFTLILLSVTLLVQFGFAAVNVIADPFRIFHDSIFNKKKHGYSRNERYQIAGFINRFLAGDKAPEGIIIGTSVSQNFKPTQVAQSFGWDGVLKLTMAGGMPFEKKFVFEKAMRSGKVSHVLWEVYGSYSAYDINKVNPKSSFPYFLYTRNPLGVLKYVFNLDTLDLSRKLFLGRLRWRPQEMEVYNNWFLTRFNSFRIFNSVENLQKVAKILDNMLIYELDRKYTYDSNLPSLEANLVAPIYEYPDTDFVLFFPPVLTMGYVMMKQAVLNRRLSMRRYLVETFADAPNVKIFAFDTMTWITNNFANYKDYQHFDQFISNYIVELISEGKGQLTLDNIDEYERSFLENIKNYRTPFSDCAALPYPCQWLGSDAKVQPK